MKNLKRPYLLRSNSILTKRERSDRPITSKVEPSITENGKAGSVTVQESRLGLMVPSTRVNGERIGHMEKDSSFMSMEISMMVNGQTIRQMDSVSICMSTVLSMRVSGEKISNTVAALRLGLTDLGMKETTLSAVSMALVPINGTMAHSTLVNGKRIKSLASESIVG